MNKLIKKLEKVVDEYCLFAVPAPVTALLDETIRSLEKDIKEFKSPNGPNIDKINKLPLVNKVIVAEALNTIKKLNYKRDEERQKQRRPHLENLKKLHEVIIAVLNEIILKLHELYKTGKSAEIVKSIKSIDTILQQTNEQGNDGYGYLKKDFKSYVNFISQLDYSLEKLPFDRWVGFATDSSNRAHHKFGRDHFLARNLLHNLYFAPDWIPGEWSNSITNYIAILREYSASISWTLRLNERWRALLEKELKLLSKLGVLYYSARSGEIRPTKFGQFLMAELVEYEELQFDEFSEEVEKILSWKSKEFEVAIISWDSSISQVELEVFFHVQKSLRHKLKVDQISKLIKSEYGLDLLG
jgi:hypothetical protein